MNDRNLRGLTSETLADQAYVALRDAIISGELAPREKITERGLADRLSVSATPVREALRRLEQDQLIERLGPRAVQVAELDPRTAAEIRLVEGTLRALAARLAAANATPEQLARLERLLDAGDAELARLARETDPEQPLAATQLATLLQLTRDFHTALNDASNNLVLLRLLSLVDAFSLTQRLRNLQGELRQGGDNAAMVHRYDEHRRVFEAVRDGDGEAAERLMRAHGATDAIGAPSTT